MLRTGEEYRESLRDGRAVWIDGERVADVPSHPAFAPIVDARARIYDMQREDAYADLMTYEAAGKNELYPSVHKPPRTKADWHDKRAWVDAVMNDLGGRRGPGRRRDRGRAVVALRRQGGASTRSTRASARISTTT